MPPTKVPGHPLTKERFSPNNKYTKGKSLTTISQSLTSSSSNFQSLTCLSESGGKFNFFLSRKIPVPFSAYQIHRTWAFLTKSWLELLKTISTFLSSLKVWRGVNLFLVFWSLRFCLGCLCSSCLLLWFVIIFSV